MKSNEHIKKFPPGEIPKCAKNQIWEAGDKNWSLGPASTGSIQKPGQPTNNSLLKFQQYNSHFSFSGEKRELTF